MVLTLICCEVFYREACALVAASPHQVELHFLPKGLHDIGVEGMRSRLQTAIDAVDGSRSAMILLGYGLCNNGLIGLRAPAIPLVVPRAHDCMTMFFGSCARYEEYFRSNPGTYFLTSGWIERGEPRGELRQLSIQHASGMDMSLAQLAEKYGEENAQYLYDQLCDQTKHYRQLTYISMGVEPDGRFREEAETRAAAKGWQFKEERGDLRLLTALVNGPWNDEEFLNVAPGRRIAADYGARLIGTAE